MITTDGSVPDLLRRFTPTPYQLKVVLDDIALVLQTNDPDLISETKAASRNVAGSSTTHLLVRVIRDYDVPGDGTDIVIVSAPPVTSLVVGRCSLIALDCERRELLGFLAASVSADMFTHQLLPILLDLLRRYSAESCATGDQNGGIGFSQKSDNSAIAH